MFVRLEEIRAEELQSASVPAEQGQMQTVFLSRAVGRYRNSVARLAVRVLFGAVFL